MPCRGILPLLMGLSPRVRGNRAAMRLRPRWTGSIPACAGEPRSSCSARPTTRVYPRVCGGTDWIKSFDLDGVGLSPRVRGNRGFVLDAPSTRGSIPACAGEPQGANCRTDRVGVYPRVCGGTASAEAARARVQGLSPRVRGNHDEQGDQRPFDGSIPACAGEPGPARRPRPVERVYPRVCGGTELRNSCARLIAGLSPRVRGNPQGAHVPDRGVGSIPACAGEPRRRGGDDPVSRVYPRVCGGTATTS